MRLSDYRPTSPFATFMFIVGVFTAVLAVASFANAIARGNLWLILATNLFTLAAVICFGTVKVVEHRRIRDEDDARSDAAEEAAERARAESEPSEPESEGAP